MVVDSAMDDSIKITILAFTVEELLEKKAIKSFLTSFTESNT